MTEDEPAPIVPILPAAATVAEALHAARDAHARAVVEASAGVFRLHAATALAAQAEQGHGQLALSALAALRIGASALRDRGALHQVALLVSIAPLPPRRTRTAHGSPAGRGTEGGGAGFIARIVSDAYECPTDHEPFSGPGVCDVHDVDLVRARKS